MKKRFLILILGLLLCMMWAPTVSAADKDAAFVMDNAALLSDSEEAALAAKLEGISNSYQAQVVVATVSSVDDGDVDSYVNTLYDELSLGYGTNRDGVLLLVSMNPREIRILSNGFANTAVGSDERESIIDGITSDLTAGNYATAFNTFANDCEYYLNGHLNGFPFQFGKNLVIALVIGLVIGVIVAFVLKGQLKSVRQQNQANVYVKANSMHLTTSNDLFLYRTVSLQKKENHSSGSSGSSSRGVSGGKF